MSRPGLAQRLPRLWYRAALAPSLWPLLPVSWMFGALAAVRRGLFAAGLLRSETLPRPVIVVGNITVGGSGKTPLVLWLVDALRAAGRQPGIVSRGYAATTRSVREVTVVAPAGDVGDEPLLLARRSGVPVFVGRDRLAAARALLSAHPHCDVIVADDGLQHYRLRRDAEIVVFDGRAAGNGRLLPAGPLREPLRRLTRASALVWNGEHRVAPVAAAALPQFQMRLDGRQFVALHDGSRTCSVADLAGRRLHALAGIGDPTRFFTQLRRLGLDFSEHPFPDHHAYRSQDLDFARDGVLLMTEKDAVKCAAAFAGEAWVLPVTATLMPAADGTTLLDTILEKIDGRTPA